MGAPKRELEDIAVKRPLVSGEKETNSLKFYIGETYAAIVGVEQRASPESKSRSWVFVGFVDRERKAKTPPGNR